jgi:hypothetical protein
MKTERIILVHRRIKDGSTFRLGCAVRNEAGWRFIPNVSSRHPSRKAHRTFPKCLPRWVKYPDGCETEEVSR